MRYSLLEQYNMLCQIALILYIDMLAICPILALSACWNNKHNMSNRKRQPHRLMEARPPHAGVMAFLILNFARAA